MPRPHTPRRIGGSLLIFFIACAFAAAFAVGDVVSVWHTHVYFEEKFGHQMPFDFLLTGWLLSGSRVLAPLGVIVLMLLVRRRAVVGIAIAALWFVFVMLPGLNILRIMAEPFQMPGWMPLLFWPLGYGLAFCIAATAYLLGSDRVASTYAPRTNIDGVFD